MGNLSRQEVLDIRPGSIRAIVLWRGFFPEDTFEEHLNGIDDLSKFNIDTSDKKKTQPVTKNNANDDIDDGNNFSKLVAASKMGDNEIIRSLVEAGGDVNERTPDGFSLIYVAVKNLKFEAAALLHALGCTVTKADVFDSVNDGIPEVLGVMIGLRAEFNVTDSKGYTPLMKAVISESITVARWLIEADVNVNTEPPRINRFESDGINQCSFDFCVTEGFLSTGCGLGMTPLHAAVYRSDLEMAIRLIEGGADLEAVNAHGKTPLLLAVFRRDIAMVNMLIGAGSCVNARDYFGFTAIHMAVLTGDLDMARLLTEDYSLYLNPRNENGKTPLHMAVLSGRRAMATLLINAGANVDKRDSRRATPLHAAAIRGDAAAASLLINAGAFLDPMDKYWNTPLASALSRGNLSVARLLINSGAYVNVRECTGTTPLQLAKDTGDEGIVRLLKSCGEVARAFGNTVDGNWNYISTPTISSTPVKRVKCPSTSAVSSLDKPLENTTVKRGKCLSTTAVLITTNPTVKAKNRRKFSSLSRIFSCIAKTD